MKSGLKKHQIKKLLLSILFFLPFVFPAVFFIFPAGGVLVKGLTPAGLLSVFKNGYYLKVIGFTFTQAFLSALFSVIAALPGAWFMSHYDFPGKRIIKALTTVPFVLPSILVVLGFVILFGNNGIINRGLMDLFNLDKAPLKILYNMRAIILAHVFYNFPVIIRIVSKFWSQAGEHEEYAAALLGAGRLRVFFTITLPKLLPSILSAASLVFMYCFMSFSIILVLGGGPKFSTLEVEIYKLARTSLDPAVVSNLAFAGLLFSLFFMFTYSLIQKKVSRTLQYAVIKREKLFSRKNSGKAVLALVYLIAVFTVITGPLLAIAGNSLTVREGFTAEGSVSLKWFADIFSKGNLNSGLSTILNTVLIGILASVFSIAAALYFSYLTNRKLGGSPLAETLLSLPLFVSSIVLGTGYLVFYRSSQANPGTVILIIALAHSVTGYPFIMRGLSSFYQRQSANVFHAAAICGASPLKVFFSVDLPVLRPAVLSSVVFAFGLSAGEFNMALILSGGKTATIPVMMYRLISAYRFNAACAYGVLLIAVSVVLFFILDRNEDLV